MRKKREAKTILESSSLAMLRRAITEEGTRAFARRVDLSPTFISRFMHGTAKPSPKMFAGVNVEMVKVFWWTPREVPHVR